MTEIENDEVSFTKKESENATETGTADQNEPTTDSTNPFKSDKKASKRKKLKKLASAEDNTQANNDEENSNVMPTPPPSKRQKKRQKKEQIVVRNKDKEIEKTIAYLIKWDSNRDEWKYEKLRQIYIQKHLFDESIISDEHSHIAMRYLSTSKGHARKIIVDAAEAIIKEIEDKITDENQEELTSSSRYERAREILQTMQE